MRLTYKNGTNYYLWYRLYYYYVKIEGVSIYLFKLHISAKYLSLFGLYSPKYASNQLWSFSSGGQFT